MKKDNHERWSSQYEFQFNCTRIRERVADQRYGGGNGRSRHDGRHGMDMMVGFIILFI